MGPSGFSPEPITATELLGDLNRLGVPQHGHNGRNSRGDLRLLAEAMGHCVPIVAYGVTAVPETVAVGGLVLEDKSPLPFASAVGRVLHDERLRAVLVEAGRTRVAGFDLAAFTRRFVMLVHQAVA